MTRLASSRGPSRSPASLLLSRADRYASRPAAAVLVVAVAGAWLIVSIVAGFPARWDASDDELHAAGHQHLSARQATLEGEDEATSRSDDAG